MLLGWIRRALASDATAEVCVIRAHLAYLFRNCVIKKEENEAETNLIVRHLYALNIPYSSYRFDVEPKGVDAMQRKGQFLAPPSPKRKKAPSKASKEMIREL